MASEERSKGMKWMSHSLCGVLMKVVEYKDGEGIHLVGLQCKWTTDWMADEHQKLISFSSRGWKSKIRMPAWLLT